ncbi:hypothetical protein DFR26_2174 [Paraperlucidibaca baekdonensis]|uniref:Pentapeptide MXKDX repeat protein n=1 Tax=Paraperlucidibaca baekdonensis TaxID=748120 RepID=A0A3E0GZY6_9GAMM|nr:hypothetical protein [Paraperlucidibaca baekdonensis]REH36128.1 hypothetical protein DFR26_2174 [Paraperlucidibaca baekdonensis]
MSFFTHSGFAMSVLLALGSQGAWAHDPAEHARAAAEAKATAKCELIQKMDTSKMDANDPVMQAMLEKCSPKSSTAPHNDLSEGERMDSKGMKMEGMKDMSMRMEHSSMPMSKSEKK